MCAKPTPMLGLPRIINITREDRRTLLVVPDRMKEAKLCTPQMHPPYLQEMQLPKSPIIHLGISTD